MKRITISMLSEHYSLSVFRPPARISWVFPVLQSVVLFLYCILRRTNHNKLTSLRRIIIHAGCVLNSTFCAFPLFLLFLLFSP